MDIQLMRNKVIVFILSVLTAFPVYSQVSLGISTSTYLNNIPVISSAHYPIWGVQYDMEAKPRFEIGGLGYYSFSEHWSMGLKLAYLRQGVIARVHYSELNSAYPPGTLVVNELNYSSLVPRISIQYSRKWMEKSSMFAEMGISRWIGIGNKLNELYVPIVEGFPGVNYTSLDNALEYGVSFSSDLSVFLELGIGTELGKYGSLNTSILLTFLSGWDYMFSVKRYTGIVPPNYSIVNSVGGRSPIDRQLSIAWIFPEFQVRKKVNE
jgi:hypothetical protein